MDGARKRKRQYCGHCEASVSHSAYYEHKRTYFRNGVWLKGPVRDRSTMAINYDGTETVNDNNDRLYGHEHEQEPENEEYNTLQDDIEEDMDLKLFLSASDSESSEDSQCDQEDFLEEEMLDDTVTEDTQVDSEKDDQHLVIKLFAYMLLAWQTVFKVSDGALLALLRCLKHMFFLIGHILGVDALCELAGRIPKTVYSLRKWSKISRGTFCQYVVCPKCKSRYTLEESYTVTRSGSTVSNTCGYVPFHKHRQKKLRQKCGTPLMKKLISPSGREQLCPRQVYCYKKIIQTLQNFVQRPGFLEKCELWRHRNVPEGVMGDVYEGEVWQDFQYVDGQPFLAHRCNFALMMNVDWHQPFEQSHYSVGVIYLVVLNLPREERFKDENMICVGLIPGPKEPKANINAYLEPLVDELRELWDGVLLSDSSSLGCRFYRAALLCVSADIPASHKCAGFVGHGALRGCIKCLKTFKKTSFGGKTDFSGFDTTNWTLRTSEEHKKFAKMTEKATTKAAQKKLEAQYGARWSELFFLPYYDAIRFVVIDPVHNLLFGTAKYVFERWIELGQLDDPKLEELQRRVDFLKVPQDVGRIPDKIASGFSGFSADQWKNWTTIFSLFCLKGLIGDQDYDMWFDFVQACIIICSRVVSVDRLEVADKYLQSFLKKFVDLYGPLKCTPNMHLHLHLSACMLDYGPVYAFWCFPSEQLNGMLGPHRNNSRNTEVQIMRKFEQSHQLQVPVEDIYSGNFINILSKKDLGSLSLPDTTDAMPIKQYLCRSPATLLLPDEGVVKALPPFQDIVLADSVKQALLTMYSAVCPSSSVLQVCELAKICRRVKTLGSILCASRGSEQRACVSAQWCENKAAFDELVLNPAAEVRPGIVKEFLVISVKMETSVTHRVVAKMLWLDPHPNRFFFGRPVEVWDTKGTETDGAPCFLPVERITSRCAHSIATIPFTSGKERVSVVIPLCTSVEI